MHTMVSNRTFQTRSIINYFFRCWISLILSFQIRHIFYCIGKMHMMSLHRIWYHFSQSICLCIRHLEHPCHISNRIFSHHFAKGSNIRYPSCTIFLGTIFNHFITSSILDIRINIWHRNSIWIQKSLKK